MKRLRVGGQGRFVLFWKTFFKVRQSVLNHDLVPCWWVHLFLFLVLVKAFGIEVANEFLMGLRTTRQGLEITDVQAATVPSTKIS